MRSNKLVICSLRMSNIVLDSKTTTNVFHQIKIDVMDFGHNITTREIQLSCSIHYLKEKSKQ